MTVNNYFGLLKAAVNGLGVCALPDYVTRDEADLVLVAPDLHSAPISTYFVYPTELRRSKRVAVFRDFVLQELEQDGLVVRKVFPVVPPHVEYSLSDKGKTLKPILLALRKWGESYV